jgi:DNA mismatch repair protein MutL
LEKLGLEVVGFGPETMAVQVIPAILAEADPLAFVRDLIDLLEEKASTLDEQELLDEMLNMAACKAAVKAGQSLSDSEIRQLLEQGRELEAGGSCPHGRPTSIRFSLAELNKQFKRT